MYIKMVETLDIIFYNYALKKPILKTYIKNSISTELLLIALVGIYECKFWKYGRNTALVVPLKQAAFIVLHKSEKRSASSSLWRNCDKPALESGKKLLDVWIAMCWMDDVEVS